MYAVKSQYYFAIYSIGVYLKRGHVSFKSFRISYLVRLYTQSEDIFGTATGVREEVKEVQKWMFSSYGHFEKINFVNVEIYQKFILSLLCCARIFLLIENIPDSN